MGYAGAKRSSISPALWVVLAALSFATLTAAQNTPDIERPELSEADAIHRARIVEAAWDATKDVGTDKAYPEAVFDRVTSYVQTTPIGEDANFKVVVYGGENFVKEVDKPNMKFYYLTGLEELWVEYQGHKYSINVFTSGTFQACSVWVTRFTDFYTACDSSTDCYESCEDVPGAPGVVPSCGTTRKCTYEWKVPLPGSGTNGVGVPPTGK